jgi:hypothetical protein
VRRSAGFASRPDAVYPGSPRQGSADPGLNPQPLQGWCVARWKMEWVGRESSEGRSPDLGRASRMSGQRRRHVPCEGQKGQKGRKGLKGHRMLQHE